MKKLLQEEDGGSRSLCFRDAGSKRQGSTLFQEQASGFRWQVWMGSIPSTKRLTINVQKRGLRHGGKLVTLSSQLHKCTSK